MLGPFYPADPSLRVAKMMNFTHPTSAYPVSLPRLNFAHCDYSELERRMLEEMGFRVYHTALERVTSDEEMFNA